MKAISPLFVLLAFSIPTFRVELVAADQAAAQIKSLPTLNAAPPRDAIVLFDGSNLDHWGSQRIRQWEQIDGPADWKILKDGTLEVVPGAGSLITKKRFGDFKLHLELRLLGTETNGGVFLMCRYELGIKDSLDTALPSIGAFANLQEPIRALSRAARPAQEWQTLDVEFRAPRPLENGKAWQKARATVWLNGIKIHDNVELDRRKGAAKRLGDAAAGPLMLQEHGATYQFRNIWIVDESKTAGKATQASAYEPKTLEIGASAPAFDLLGVDGKRYSLDDFANKSVLVVIFTTNHCPDAIASYSRMRQMVDEYSDRDVGFVAINGNDPQAVMLNELRWTQYDDSYESMKIVANEEKFNLPYLYDGETQKVTKAYGAIATPHVFVFDRQRRLRYTGRLDNGHRNPQLVAKSEARDAVDSLLAGKPVSVEKTRVFGCSIKWSDKRSLVTQEEREWNDRPVTVASADTAAIKQIVATDSPSLRLINVWSTSCGPCVTEFPKLVETYRRFQNHPFEFITISVDSPEEQDQVAGFLQDQHAALARRTERLIKKSGRKTNNFLFTGEDLEEVAVALDKQWMGGQPHTLLIAENGEVLFRQTGTVDFESLQAAIVKYVRAHFLK